MKKDRKQEYEAVGELVRIFQRGRRWFANFQFEGKQQRKAVGTASKKEARRRALLLDADLQQGRFRHDTKPSSIESAIAAYEKYLTAERRAAKTIAKYKKVFERILDLAQRLRRPLGAHSPNDQSASANGTADL